MRCTTHTEELDENIQVLSYSIDYDNYFHRKHNVYELHEYDDDRKHNEQQRQKNVVLAHFPIVQHRHRRIDDMDNKEKQYQKPRGMIQYR